MVDPNTVPPELEITAWTENNVHQPIDIMALSEKENYTHGVQFHPESISSEFGHKLIENFLRKA